MDDLEPILSTRPQALEDMSVDELRARIVSLQNEIAACETEIEKKEAHKSAADALFGE